MDVDVLTKTDICQDLQISMQFNCSAARSIEHLTIKSQKTDIVIIGFAYGKILQICVDLCHLQDIETDPEKWAPFLDFEKFVESRLNVENQELDSAKTQSGLHEDLNID